MNFVKSWNAARTRISNGFWFKSCFCNEFSTRSKIYPKIEKFGPRADFGAKSMTFGSPKWIIFVLLFGNFSKWRIYPPLGQEHDFHDFNVRKIEYFSIIFLQFWSFFQVAFGGVKNYPEKVIFYVKNWFLRFSVTLPNRGIDHFGSQICRRSCKEGLWSVKSPTAPKPKSIGKHSSLSAPRPHGTAKQALH